MTALNELLPHGYIDAHHHVWAPESRADIGYGWLRDVGAIKPFGDPTPIQRDYLMEEFLSEALLRPRASVHVQTDGTLPDPVIETRFVQAEADRVGSVVKIVGLVDLRGADLAVTLARHGESADFCGVRQIVARLPDRPELSFAPQDFLKDPQWVTGLKRLKDSELSFDLQMYPEQSEDALEALSATPALRVIIDHALCPYDPTDEGFERWSKAVAMMARRPNTYMKLSGWGMYQTDWAHHGAGAIARYIDVIIGEFGASRVMWGSNFPVEKLATTYDLCLAIVAQHFNPQDRDAVFNHTVSEAYGLFLT